MLTLIHTADVHLGAKFVALGERAQAQRELLRATFSKVVEAAVSSCAKEPTALLVSGDLFDSTHPSRLNTDFILEQFRKLEGAGCYIFVIPGTHDSLTPGSVWSREVWDEIERLHVFREPSKAYHYIEELKSIFFGYPLIANRGKVSPVKALKDQQEQAVSEHPDAATKIALIHGSLQIPGRSAPDDWPFTKGEIEGSGFDYVAVGHWHSTFDCGTKKTKAWYSGAPEAIDIDQRGAGSYLEVAVDGGKTLVKPIKVGVRVFDSVILDVGKYESRDALIEAISEGADAELARLVKLEGVAPAEWNLDEKELELLLREKFYSLKIESSVGLNLDQIAEGKFSESLATGKFVQVMKEKIDKEKSSERQELLREALAFGFNILRGVS